MHKTREALARDFYISRTKAWRICDDIRRGIGTQYPESAIEDKNIVVQYTIRRTTIDEDVFRDALAAHEAHDGRRKAPQICPGYTTIKGLMVEYGLSNTTVHETLRQIRNGVGTTYPADAILAHAGTYTLVKKEVFQAAREQFKANDRRGKWARTPKPKTSKPKAKPPKGYATKKDLMAKYGISRATVNRLIASIRDHNPDAVRSGRMTLVDAKVFRAALDRQRANDRRKVRKTTPTPEPKKRTKRTDYSSLDDRVIQEVTKRLKQGSRFTSRDVKAFIDNPSSVIDFADLHEAYDREGQAFDVSDYVIDVIEDAYM